MENLKIKNTDKKEEANLLNILGMYDIPGHDEITEQQLKRYKNDKEIWETDIKNIANIRSSYNLEDKERLLKYAINSDNATTQLSAMESIGASEFKPFISSKLKKILEEGSSPDTHTLEMLQFADKSDVSNFIEEILETKKPEIDVVRKIQYAEVNYIPHLIIKSLEHEDDDTKIAAISMIQYAKAESRLGLVVKALENKNPSIQKAISTILDYINISDRDFLYELMAKNAKDILDGNDQEAKIEIINIFKKIPKQYSWQMIEDIVNGEDTKLQIKILQMLSWLRIEASDRFYIIQRSFESASLGVRLRVLDVSDYRNLNSIERKVIIYKALHDEEIAVRLRAISANDWGSYPGLEKKKIAKICKDILVLAIKQKKLDIRYEIALSWPHMAEEDFYILKKDITEIVSEALEAGDSNNIEEASRLIYYTLPNKKRDLVTLAIESDNITAQMEALSTIDDLSEEDRLTLIKKAMRSQYSDIRAVAISKSIHLGYDTIEPLLKVALDDPSDNVRERVISKAIENIEIGKIIKIIRASILRNDSVVTRAILNSLSEVNKNLYTEEIFTLIENSEMAHLITETPLYSSVDISEQKMSRKPFAKTGSTTTLLGGTLRGKAIVRHIEPESFLVWQRLYEDYNLWKDNDFDYIPIEPIISFRLDKDGNVATFSGVLDIDLYKWTSMTTRFQKELLAQRDKILEVLDVININHGHPHNANFCLRFWRDSNGKPILTKMPRIYLIDFDQAKYSV